MTTHQIRVILFDFGGVLMRTVDPRPRRNLEHRIGLPRGGAEEAVFENASWDDLQMGRLAANEFWSGLGDRLGLDAAGVADFQRDFWAGDRIDENLTGLIRQLRESGYHTLLLSNAPADRAEHLAQLGMDELFDTVMLSGQEGVMKPDARAYELALRRVGAVPEEALFVDDFRENVAAAASLGIQAHRFRGVALLRPWLATFGISVPAPVMGPLDDIRAVIFDWAGVIEGSPDLAYFAVWEDRLGLKSGDLPWILWSDVWRQVEEGQIPTEHYYQVLAEQLHLDDVQAAARFIEEFYDGDWLYPEVVAAIRALHGRYRLALLSNAYAEQDKWLRRMFNVDVTTDFDVYVNSARVGMCKPEPAIYELVLDELAVEAGQAVFLDDSLRNVDVAGALGIHTIHVAEPALALAELEALLGHPIDTSS